jgi:hypothetical protein
MSYIYDLTDTWNNVATTFTAIKMNATDTASASGSMLIDLQVGGVSQFNLRKDGVATFAEFRASTIARITSDTGSLTFGAGSDAILTRDAADTLAQRRGTNAQAFRVYNTFTDASNYERGEFAWGTNILNIGATNAGTGTSRIVRFVGGGVTWLAINAASAASGGGIWNINTNGHLLAGTDNTYDIGASGATRPRSIYAATSIIGTTVYGGTGATGGGYLSASTVGFVGRAALASSADGIIRLINAADNDFGRLQFGGGTSSFPALRRTSTSLETVLADNSAYSSFNAGDITACTGTAIPAGGTAGAGLKVSSTANFGVFFGSGAPTLSAAKGSLYLRSDGSGINDRMYVNTDSATTWTAVVTAA